MTFRALPLRQSEGPRLFFSNWSPVKWCPIIFVAFQGSALPLEGHECLLPFVTMYHLAVKNLKQLLMEHWSLIHNQPLLKQLLQNFRPALIKGKIP